VTAALPAGWRMARFDEIAESIGERVEPGDADTEYYVGLEHLDTESLKIRRWGTPDDVEATKLRFRTGDIIFGRRRVYQRKVAVAEFDGICSAHAMVIRAREDVIDKDFLPFLMQSSMFMDRALSISVGSLSPTINWSVLRRQEFPLPPKDQQCRIAEILWAATEVAERIDAAVAQADTARRTILRSCFVHAAAPGRTKTSPLGPVPVEWDVVRIGDAGEVQLGRQRAPKYQSGSHTKPYLRVANVFDGYLDLTDVLEMDFDDGDFKTFALKPGDILLNEGQSRELVGRCAVFNGEIRDCCFQNTLVRFRAGPRLLEDFAFAYLRHAFYAGVFAAVASQTTSIAHLGADRFARLYMPIPPKDEQTRFVRMVNDITAGQNRTMAHRECADRMRRTLREQCLAGTSMRRS